ncbi:MAG TPA: NUDIX domain-containing protein [Hanamia sp.]|nr:NUDIX domain-containing protein [Hanamia sp.]
MEEFLHKGQLLIQFMTKKSAGLLLYHFKNNLPEVLLVHPGGPFWAKKEIASWSIPKGEIEENEDPLKAAIRETKEETGISIDLKDPVPLKPLKQKSGKIIFAWMMPAEIELGEIKSNLFEMEWPKGSGKTQSFAEVDKAAWFNLQEARKRIVQGQVPFIEEFENILNG